MVKIAVTTGVYLISSADNSVRVLCGCPVDAIKLLLRRGLIQKIEKNGVDFELGPNAILLSDLSTQNGQLCNMIEFPLMHMQFRQGMVIPQHPNNDGRRPILLGLPQQIESQCRYFSSGKYGLSNEEELLASGIDQHMATEIMRFKRCFNYGKMDRVEDTLDLRPLRGSEEVELAPGFFLRREGFNVYEFREGEQQISVDLNLAANEYYESPYHLSHHPPAHDYFSVVHLGEGNGWDHNRPNMCSLICFQGKYYLIDAPAGVDQLLQNNGIAVNELEGIFHSHSHDDHFAGLPSLIQAEHPIKYYATGPVRHSVIKKFTALLDCHESMFHRAFACYNLRFDRWNNIDGLQVLPCLSPHPVETSLFYFRTLWHGGYKTYGHLADIGSDRVLKSFIVDDPSKDGISLQTYQRVKRYYTIAVDLKKIDVGGGLIHGDANDFRNDRSRRIILSHTETSLTTEEREIGSSATFGLVDVLIPAETDLMRDRARESLKKMFPTASNSEINIMLNQTIQTLNVGSIILKKGQRTDCVLLLVSGTVERIDLEQSIIAKMSAGSVIGHMVVLLSQPSSHTYYATSYIKVLAIPADVYRFLVQKYHLAEKLVERYDLIQFLQKISLFESNITDLTLNHLAEQVNHLKMEAGSIIAPYRHPGLYLVRSGSVAIFDGEEMRDLYLGRGVFGEESIINEQHLELHCKVLQDAQLLMIPAQTLLPIPNIIWQLRESLYNKLSRMRDRMDLPPD